MDNKKSYTLSIIAGLILIILGFAYQLLNLSGNFISLIFLNAGIIIMVIAVLKYNKYGAGITQDEMTRKISSKALSYSWLTIFVVTNILFWIDYLNVWNLKVQTLLGIIIFIIPVSVAIFKKLILIKGKFL